MSVAAAYLGVILIWSTTPLAIKWSGEAGGFLVGVSGRMFIGVLICGLLIKWRRLSVPVDRKALWSYAAVSITIYGAMLVTYWGAQFIPSGLISVLFGCSPIITSLLTALVLKQPIVSLSKWLGMVLGLLGLILIFHKAFHVNAESIKGLFAILCAVFLHAFSAVSIKRLDAPVSPLALTYGGLVIASVLYSFTWLVAGMPWPHSFSTRALCSIIYLGILGSVVGFMLYYYILQHVDAPKVALTTLVTPIIALFLGQWLNQEVITATTWLGATIVLTGLALYQWGSLVTIWLRQKILKVQPASSMLS